ncbi:MAG: anaerobic ribonucleoside-triphosphate reductase activating protein [Lachnospiraceae bacterium]|nr:anaerobic ribonucleoside-triphosphate reductase activating protein [Lachnospiraceae bacterium]
MNYSEIKNYDIANGPGVRVSLFVSGCTHHCEGCFNEMTWDFAYGNPFDTSVQEQLLADLAPDYIAGLSLLGGEPLEYVNWTELLPWLKTVKEKYPQKDIWCYTGYRFEEDILNRFCRQWNAMKEFLSCIDVLVDGPFLLAQKDISLQFRGSRNQRIISVQESLQAGSTILWHESLRQV